MLVQKNKLFILVSLSLICLLFIRLTCTGDDDGVSEFGEPCDKTKLTEGQHENITFYLYLNVHYNDGIPFDGKVTFRMYKQYCNGKVSGDSTNDCINDQNGRFWANAGYNQYWFKNENDRVYYEFTAYYTPYYPANELTKTLNGHFDYKSAMNLRDELDRVRKSYEMTIPTDEYGH